MPKGALPAVESSLSVTQRFWPVGRGKAGQNLSMKMKPCLTKELHLMLNADAMKQGKNESFLGLKTCYGNPTPSICASQ